MKRVDLRSVFLLFIIINLCFSFTKHYHKSLDGDMANVVLGYPEVMSDPLGFNAIFKDSIYGGTNRFFAHWSMSSYFKTAPGLFQTFASPIESIYLASALAKTLIQAVILFSISYLICNGGKLWDYNFLFTGAILTPLFQTNGYNRYMGIINPSITYTFFYSLTVALILLLLIPINKYIVNNNWKKVGSIKIVSLALLALFIALGGPLGPALIIIGLFILLLRLLQSLLIENSELPIQNRYWTVIQKIPTRFLILSITMSIFSFYSLYLGQFNAENYFHSIPLMERYKLLPTGLYYPFTQKLGLPVLLIAILVNVVLLWKSSERENARKIMQEARWILLFIAIYILILPLGGYREYRPNILRVDTLLPVILSMFYVFGKSTLYLIQNLSKGVKRYYATGIIFLLLIYVFADKAIAKENDCEKSALEVISQSTESVVRVNGDCNVMAWNKIIEAKNSKLNCELLKRWGVINDDKLYYQ